MDNELFKQVFQACDPDENGFISLKNLANISRSHVASAGDVDAILHIFDNSKQDSLNFSQFCDYIHNFMNQNKDKENVTPPESGSPDKPDIQISATDQPNVAISPSKHHENQRMLGANLSNKRKMSRKNSKSRVSQTRLGGQIPLVNTSSEDEQDLEEDSFDRKIAEELEFAGRQLESSSRLPPRASPPRYLVRGSNVRSTLRSKSSGRLPFVPLVVTESPKQTTVLSPISAAETSIDMHQPPNFDDSVAISPPTQRMDSLLSVGQNDGLSRHSSPINRSVQSDDTSNKYEKRELAHAKEVVEELEQKLSSLESSRFDSLEQPSIDNCFKEPEDDIEKIRKQAKDDLAIEKERHREEIRALSRERELEISNYKLRMEQLQSELDRISKEKTDLNEKVRLLFVEKEGSEETVLKLQEDILRLQQENKSLHSKVNEGEMSRDTTRDKISEVSKMSLGSDQMSTTESYESEYLVKIQQMAARIQEQDDYLQELKEDNLVLRNQKRALLDAFNNEKNWKRSFLGANSRNRSMSGNDNSMLGLDTDDPQDIRVRTSRLHKQLVEQTDMYKKLKAYLDEVLMTIMIKNPEILEKSHG
eukprot:TRINITY_DN5939_c0_g1_i6.p1 TRINITY_DN5939_c0_g1~~TRINITY_DN5939_c0_g1_i6.p1  ORF type:complete len:591 (-),score=131.31 TRINITY_DN5939_c0_g1_i6:781-2553(-)